MTTDQPAGEAMTEPSASDYYACDTEDGDHAIGECSAIGRPPREIIRRSQNPAAYDLLLVLLERADWTTEPTTEENA